MKRRTSWPSSRKYSAIVRPARATRRRAPGGSFIWPKTSAVFSITPDSVISSQRSLPSRERSPTPENTDRPSCSAAMLRISSWMSTVLPTPAPPKRPTLPPFTYGARRSMTLIPVSKISTVGSSSSKRGSGPVDRPAVGLDAACIVDRLTEDVEDPAEGDLADRHRDRRAGVLHLGAARDAVGRVHRHRAHTVVSEVLLHLGDEEAGGALVGLGELDSQRVVDGGQLAVEDGVDDDALDLDDPADVLRVRVPGHESPG